MRIIFKMIVALMTSTMLLLALSPNAFAKNAKAQGRNNSHQAIVKKKRGGWHGKEVSAAVVKKNLV